MPPRKRYVKGERLPAQVVNDLLDFRDALESLTGTHDLQLSNLEAMIGRAGYLWAHITSSTLISTYTNRWTYAWAEVQKATPGSTNTSGNWTAKTGGRTGTAYNTYEKANPNTGAMGNGINTTLAKHAGFAVKPCPNLIVAVKLYPVRVVSTGVIEWWFDYANAFDGECAP